MSEQGYQRTVMISDENLEGDLAIPSKAEAIILFVHGSGSSRHSTRNQYLAETLNNAGFATLLVDLLTSQEKEIDEKSNHLRFNIDLLAARLESISNWIFHEPQTRNLAIGYFGSSTGAAAALLAASNLRGVVKTIVCRGGRVDLADAKGVLDDVKASTLLIVGGKDAIMIGMNKRALEKLSNAAARELVVIPNATHLFEEPGKMEEVAQVAAEWFEYHLLKKGKIFVNKYHDIEPKNLRFRNFFDKSPFLIKFKDRTAAGEMLASLLRKYKDGDKNGLIIIGIPRGGVAVADVIAKRLQAKDFDIIIPRKLRAPDNSENAIGAVMHDGSTYLDKRVIETLKISNEYIEQEKVEQTREIEKRGMVYRPQTKEYNIRNRTVILVDDGAATGATLIVCARWIKKQEPRKVVIAVPVAPRRVIELLRSEADRTEVIRSTSTFKSVDQFYQDYDIVTDQDVVDIMKDRNY